MKHLLAGLRSCVLSALIALALLAPAAANQSNTWSPTTGTVSGLQLTTNYNNAFSAIQSCNSGNSAPANDQTAAAVKGQCWLNTSTTPNTVEMYDGASWATVGWLDTTNHLWIANNGGGTGTIASSSASAGILDIGTIQNPVLSITGTTTLTGLGSTAIAGTQKFLNFTGILTLTHNGTSLILPNGGSNITTAAGDTAIAEALGSGNWRVVSYQLATGFALAANSNFSGAVNFNSVISPAALGANTNNWNPASLSTANVIRLSCSTPGFNITGLTAPSAPIEGRVVVLDNVGSFNCTLTSNDTNSTAASRFLFDKPIALRPTRTVTIKYDNTSAGWVLWQEVPSQLVMGGFKNLRILNVTNAFGDTAPGTPNNQNKILVDEIALEDANGGVFRIDQSYAYSCTVDITGGTFNASTGGIDTGAVAASTWYYHWIIYNPTTNTPSCLDSVSSTAPTLPAGFTFKARVGANQTDASANKCFYRVQQYGRIAHYVAVGTIAGCTATNGFGPVSFFIGNVGTPAAGSPTLVAKQVTGNTFPAPATAVRVQAVLDGTYNAGTGTMMIAHSQAYSGTGNGPGGGNLFVYQMSLVASLINSQWFTLESNSLSVASSGGTTTNFFGVSDWEDGL